MAKLISLVLLALCVNLSAAESKRPTVPPPEDFIKSIGETPRSYLQSKQKDAACVADLAKTRAEYAKIVADVAALKAALPARSDRVAFDAAAAKIDAGSDAFYAQRDKLLDLIEKCGECTTEPVKQKKIDVGAGSTQIWYFSFGWCQIPSTDRAVLDKAYPLISESLVHADRYPKGKPGGFNNILGFQITDKDGKIQDKVDRFPASPINIFLSVLGPMGTGFRYFLKGEYWFTDKPTDKHFQMDFDTVPKPPKPTQVGGYVDPKNYLLSGKEKGVTYISLPNVQGQWYVNDDGYLHYYTAAHIPIAATEVETKGRRVLQDTLTAAVARGEWQLP